MLSLKFGGWVQCRLATDPDPYDEPRGVSGYIHAYAGEPDLDRILRFQTPPFSRKYAPIVGVIVKAVQRNGRTVQNHPCVGALVDLLDEPKLEGRNGIVAEDALEPIYPFHLELRSGAAFVRRSIVPTDPDFPYPEYLSQGTGQVPPSEIFAESGVSDLKPIWAERRRLLVQDLSAATEDEKPGIEERLTYIEKNINRDGISGPDALAAAMSYDYELKSELSADANGLWVTALFDNSRPSTTASWQTQHLQRKFALSDAAIVGARLPPAIAADMKELCHDLWQWGLGLADSGAAWLPVRFSLGAAGHRRRADPGSRTDRQPALFRH